MMFESGGSVVAILDVAKPMCSCLQRIFDPLFYVALPVSSVYNSSGFRAMLWMLHAGLAVL
tara:strand:+ start:374 stop:556 length:183 start_codon:yes stop_codon:yes gene_type:complete